MWYSNNSQDLNSLMFLKTGSEKFNNHTILPNLQSLLDYTSLSVVIIVEKEFIWEKKQFIIRNSNKEKEFINKLRYRIGSTVTSNITSCEILKYITQEFAFIAKDLWNKFLIFVNITKRSKAWWNKEWNKDSATY